MKILGIDTATEIASVGVIGNGEKELTRHCHRTLSRDLISMIDEVLSGSETTLKDLDGIAISIGPGSFTGLRIGLATAKGMSFSIGTPVIPVRTLDALAGQVSESGHPIAVVQQARKGEVYFGMYGNKGNEQQSQHDDCSFVRP